MRDFSGRTAVVTGAASGIGRALAERFAHEGMNVVLTDVEEGALARAVSALEGRGQRALGVVTDVGRRESALAQRALAAFVRVHGLRNNAGVLGAREGTRAVWELPRADWEWVNFWGVMHGLQVFVPYLLAHGEPGHVVNTASVTAWLPGGGPNGVSKHGVLSLSESLHADLCSRGAKIGASVLCPGWIDPQLASAERRLGSRRACALRGCDRPGSPGNARLRRHQPPPRGRRSLLVAKHSGRSGKSAALAPSRARANHSSRLG